MSNDLKLCHLSITALFLNWQSGVFSLMHYQNTNKLIKKPSITELKLSTPVISVAVAQAVEWVVNLLFGPHVCMLKCPWERYRVSSCMIGRKDLRQ